MSKAVKLADIAEKMGVSTVTVSKALSDQKGVSEDLRVEIKKLASSLGYVSPSAAKLQSERKSYNIGVLVSDRYFGQTQSFYWLMYQELATKAVAKNCFTMLEVVPEEDEDSNNVPRLLEGDRINGLVVLGLMKKEYLKMLTVNTRVPVIHLDFYDSRCGCDAVVSDNYYGMYQMVDYLCRMGHTKIAYVGTLLSTNSITDRYFGYCKALCEHGIEIRKDYIVNDRSLETGSTDGVELVLPEDMPTAFACNCDVSALALIAELEKRGYRVPEDISVVGFDDYVFQNVNDVKLTTYAVDVKEMARKAIKVLIKKMSGEFFAKGLMVVEGKMVVRETVKDIRA